MEPIRGFKLLELIVYKYYTKQIKMAGHRSVMHLAEKRLANSESSENVCLGCISRREGVTPCCLGHRSGEMRRRVPD